jgi:hypothetical protein
MRQDAWGCGPCATLAIIGHYGRMKLILPVLLLGLLITACGPGDPPPPVQETAPDPAPAAAAPSYPPVEPIAPGLPGGLPDDRTPVSEARFTTDSTQGAANVVQTYFAHIGAGAHGQAYGLWADDGAASNLMREQFIASFGRYYQYDAQIGAPGPIEGAAGSMYVSVPVQLYGRLRTGEPFHQRGEATLRRVNDVPGSTETQRLWRISRIEVSAVP